MIMKPALLLKQLHFFERTLVLFLFIFPMLSCSGKTRDESNNRYSSTYREEHFHSFESAEEDMVWVVSKGKKYHRNAACSNMKAPILIYKKVALERGYTACAKCY